MGMELLRYRAGGLGEGMDTGMLEKVVLASCADVRAVTKF